MRYIWALLAMGMVTMVQARESFPSVDEFIAAELPVSGAPGLAYGVVEEGEIFADAYGEVRIGSGRNVTPDTPFPIGSISKSFTAMAVMTLVEAGEVELDREISHYLGVFSGGPGASITIRQLLSHTSGYSTRQGNDTHKDQGLNGDELSNQVARIAQWSPAHEPGSAWQYSNANYLVLGALIEAVSGQDYASFIETEILAPIGMTHSFVADGESHDGMAVGHQPWWFGTKRALKDTRTHRVTAPAGGIIASAHDLALYLAVMMNGQDDIISAESKAAMMRPASEMSPLYGLGWAVDPDSGTVYHSGLTPGVETLAILEPGSRKAAVVLVNANSGFGFGVTGGLLNGVSALALGHEYDGSPGGWGPKSLYLIFVLVPVLFAIGILQAVLRPDRLRAKSGLFGAFSLWFPLVMTLALAWTALYLIPKLFGVSLTTFYLYQPDFVLLLVATAATGLLWAVLRLGVAYSR